MRSLVIAAVLALCFVADADAAGRGRGFVGGAGFHAGYARQRSFVFSAHTYGGFGAAGYGAGFGVAAFNPGYGVVGFTGASYCPPPVAAVGFMQSYGAVGGGAGFGFRARGGFGY